MSTNTYLNNPFFKENVNNNLNLTSYYFNYFKLWILLDNKQKTIIILRIVLIFLVSGVTFINTFTSIFLPDHADLECMKDNFHFITSNINKYLNKYNTLRCVLFIICGLLIDMLVLFRLYFFIYKENTYKLMISIFILSFFKIFNNLIYESLTPLNYAWKYPGFPSITLSYVETNTYYFNMTIALLAISIINLRKLKVYFVMGLFSLAYYSFLLICTRGNYSIDIFAGIFFGFYIDMLSESITVYIDNNKYIGFYYEKYESLLDINQSRINSNDEFFSPKKNNSGLTPNH